MHPDDTPVDRIFKSMQDRMRAQEARNQTGHVYPGAAQGQDVSACTAFLHIVTCGPLIRLTPPLRQHLEECVRCSAYLTGYLDPGSN